MSCLKPHGLLRGRAEVHTALTPKLSKPHYSDSLPSSPNSSWEINGNTTPETPESSQVNDLFNFTPVL